MKLLRKPRPADIVIAVGALVNLVVIVLILVYFVF
jgi:hypothetical protein